MDSLAATGDADVGWSGFLNHSSVTVQDAAASGTSSSRAFVDKTPDLIVADFVAAVNEITGGTNGVEQGPFRVVLPDEQFNDIMTRRLTDSSETLGSFLVGKMAAIESIVPWHRCDGAGDTGDRMVLYTPSPDKLDVRVPVEYEALPPQFQGLETIVPVHARFGGFALYYPSSMLYVDQI